MATLSAALIPVRAGYRLPEDSLWLHGITPGTSSVSSVRQRFDGLVSEWQSEKKYISSTDDMVSLASYREIIAMGEPAVPLILNELQRQPDHWFHALVEITGADPVPPEHRGRLRLMARHWLDWGRSKGYLR